MFITVNFTSMLFDYITSQNDIHKANNALVKYQALSDHAYYSIGVKILVGSRKMHNRGQSCCKFKYGTLTKSNYC